MVSPGVKVGAFLLQDMYKLLTFTLIQPITMKNFILILFITTLSISITSCSKKQDPKPEPVITWISGKWVRVAATESSFSSYVELYFDTETTGRNVAENMASNQFSYSLSTMTYTGGTGNKWQINKISDTDLSIGTPGVTILTYYKKQ